jgi:hypothetical protein
MTVLSLRARGGSPLRRKPGTRPFGETSSSSFGFSYGSTSSADVEDLIYDSRNEVYPQYCAARQIVHIQRIRDASHLVVDPEILESNPRPLHERTEAAREKRDRRLRFMRLHCCQCRPCCAAMVRPPRVCLCCHRNVLRLGGGEEEETEMSDVTEVPLMSSGGVEAGSAPERARCSTWLKSTQERRHA